jgi:hypothetical protein
MIEQTFTQPFRRAFAFLVGTIFVGALFVSASVAAELPKKSTQSDNASNVPEVPGDDIFGFTAPTDIGNPGDTGFANENDGFLGKRSGSYSVLASKFEFSRTLPDNWWIAGSFFSIYNHASNVPDMQDVNRFQFFGLSFEIERRILRRSAGNPFAISVSIEPAWGRIDGATGLSSNSLGAAFKFFVDAVVVPDKLFWAANLVWAPQSSEDLNYPGHWVASSTTLASTALTYQVSSKLFMGVEVRFFSAFESAWPTNNTGNALYVGPTLLWRITDKVAFNTTYQPQVSGHAKGSPDPRLDLDNFQRAQFRAKFAVAF